ncbi:hypothetical protein P0100_18500 [Yersinia pestis]|uniref:hypothetical protein n=2 Tax=Paenibacillus TaxID=44249 RepID=UPI00256B0A6B|nr:hypothetical protein [Paenibacillus lautus]MDL1163029.1 hypothetical protein [Yersinia pestis]MEC0257707.1 hypothetical protein [Paenibacillus lautus]
MFNAKRLLSFLLVFALVFSAMGVVSAEVSPEEKHLQTAITEGRSTTPISELSEEEANRVIEKLNETAEVIEVEVTRPSTTPGASVQAVDVAVVKVRPTYGFYKVNGVTGHVSVHLEVWVEGGDIATLINRVRGYAAFSTNVEGQREEINYVPFPPNKVVYVTEETDIRIDYDTDLVMWKGYATVSLLGGWSDADIFFDNERYL